MKRAKDYSDIINLPHHVSKIHPRMKISDRAAQFSPFAALTGHSEAVKETARLVDQKLELDENQTTIINNQLNNIKEHINEYPEVTIVYFQQDSKKTGGVYIKVTDKIIKVDDYKNLIILETGIKILFEDIYSIDDVKYKDY